MSKNPDPEYYNKEVKRLKVKVRKMYDMRKFGQTYQEELKRLSKELLVAKKKAQETFYVRSYKTRVDAGQSFISMLNGVKEVEKVFRRSRIKAANSSQIQQKRPNPLTLIMRLSSVANVIIRKFN